MAAAKKTVCIIGAGPAGLVAAKTFLRTGQCNVTIYEKADRLGGIWALDEQSIGDYLSPQTPTNLSRFTVGFSDLSWESVKLNGESTGNDVPMFPRAWQVNKYLETYRAKFVPDGTIQYGHEVTATSRKRQLAVGAKEFWVVTTKNQHGVEEEKEFDHLIVASGFFSTPRPLQRTVCAGLENLPIKAIHSSRFRNLDDLFPGNIAPIGKTVLVIGGGNSSGEVAAAVASHLSNAQWATDPVLQQRFAGFKIIHVTPRPLYGIPPFVPTGDDSTSFVPVDFHLYNLARRLAGEPITGSAGRVTDGVKNMIHQVMENMLGGNQSDLGADALVARKGSERATVQVALSESYPEYVRSRLIEVRAGRVTNIAADDSGKTSVTIKLGEDNDTIGDIGAIVYATGYSPATALGMLHQTEKKALNFDADSMRLPLILEQWQTMSKQNSNPAFIGFYEGPYWPIMEMQARLTAARWLDEKQAPQKPQEEAEKLLELREAMQARGLDVPQYWFGDYLGYMEELARELQLQRNDGHFAEREGAVSPARYLAPADEKLEADKIMTDMYKVWKSCREKGAYVPRAVFRALHGNWHLHRRIVSTKGALPSGVFSGTARFLPRFPTPDNSGGKFDFEYLYIETGTFTPAEGQPIPASRRYVYRYSELQDQLSVWFVKPDRNLEVDYLFHNLAFTSPDDETLQGRCVAKADHLCVDDMYATKYQFSLAGISLRAFEVTYKVKGPSKDYVAISDFRRELKRPSEDH